MSLKASMLRKDVNKMIDDQPIVIHRYILLEGDGVITGNSWSWAGSWCGRRDPMGRNVWFTQRNILGEQAQRMYVVLLPYAANIEGNPITPRDRVELRNLDGTALGEFLVVWALGYTDKNGDVWKYELNIEERQ